MAMIRENLSRLRGEIQAVCQRIGRDPGKITIVGVTKIAKIPHIKEALAEGLKDIGENKVQAAQEKFKSADWAFMRRHMIGHLQTNKVKDALEVFDVIQSVDSLKLAKAIHDQAVARGTPVEIFVQVNTSGEEQKFGLTPQETVAFFKDLEPLDHLRVTGLMTIAPMTEHQGVIRQCFRDLKQLFEKIKSAYKAHPHIRLTHLSMGMSQDFEIALEEGATMLRIGTAIFGERK